MTGALQPVGKAVVAELAEHGAAAIFACSSTVLSGSHAVFDDEMANLKADVAKQSPNTTVVPFPVDVTSEQEILQLIDEILNSYGRLDIWVASSGLLGPSSVETTTPSDLQKCFESNSLAPFLALKYAKPAMMKTAVKGSYGNAAPKDRPYGSIIVVTSVASTYGGRIHPSASEHANKYRLLGSGTHHVIACRFGGCPLWSARP